MSRVKSVLALTTVVAAIAGCDRAKLSLVDDDAPEEVEAISGGTIMIDGRHIHLAGIDVPRTVPQAGCWAEALLAREAHQALSRAVSHGDRVDVEPGGATRAGQAAARVTVDGKDLSRLLIQAGLAAPTGGTAWDWCGPVVVGTRNAPSLNYPTADAIPRRP